MQTKKKNHGRNDAREHASPRGGRSQRKVSDDSPVVGKKASGLIASARKQKSVSTGINAKQNGNLCALKIASNGNQLACHDTRVLPLAQDDVAVVNSDYKACDQKIISSASETIFSPSFHISKDIHVNKGIAIENCESDAVDVHCDNQHRGEILSPEVSAIYLAMQHSKLECIDEPNYYSEVYVEAEEDEVFDDFDPYSFIGSLPDLSAIVPTFRPMLLPKQTRSCPSTTLVLDLDETLVHSTLDYCEDADFTFPVNFNLQEHTIYVRCRPFLKDFMERVSSLFEIIIFTASQSIYAEQLLNVLDPKRKIFRHRVYRESCVFVEGNYLKDLSVLGRDLAHVAIIDNSPQAFGFQVDNGIPIESWFDDRSDCELLSLLPFLESLVGVDDVRPVIAKRFNLREKVAAASYPSFSFSNGNGNPVQRKVK